MDEAGSCEVKLFPKRNPLRAAKTERATVWVKRKGKVRLVLVENPRLAFSFLFFLKRGRYECYLIKIQGSALLDFLLTAGLEGNSRDPTVYGFFFSGSQ